MKTHTNPLQEELIVEKAEELLRLSQEADRLLLKKNRWYKTILSHVMGNAQLKTNLFRFIDVLPSLSDERQFLSHFKEYFKDQDLGVIAGGLGHLSPSLLASGIKRQIRQMAKMFITGADIESALNILLENWQKGFGFSMDILGEDTLSEKEAQGYFNQYLHLMDNLKGQSWPEKNILQTDRLGKIPSVNISIKASSLFSQIKTEAWDYSKEGIKKRLRPLLQKAVRDFIFVNLDMEHYHHKDLFLEIFKDLLAEEDFKHYPHFGIALQTYLKDSPEDLRQLAGFAQKRNFPLTIRLVKGAYWDSETLLARQKDWPVPVYARKAETDANFESCMQWLFCRSSRLVKIAVGSHNIRSIACALAWHERFPDRCLEFQFLYGMGEGLAQALVDKGYCVRLYSTVGKLIPGMSYLARRLLENSSNQSFVLNSLIQNKSTEELLASPHQAKNTKSIPTKSASRNLYRSTPPRETLSQTSTSAFQKNTDLFANHPHLDFSKKNNRWNFQKALEKAKRLLPLEIPLIIEGKRIKTSQKLKRENPSQINQTVSHSFLAQKEQAEQAVLSTTSFFERWRAFPPQKRMACVQKLALLMKKQEFELAGIQVLEVGKTWSEAHADVAEAIDFCSYYALTYEELIKEKKTAEVSGEDSFARYEAIGPTAVIAPWNFPLAILTGMTIAPLLCGNTVLIKPAEQSPWTAFRLAELLLQSGFPRHSFAFLPGRGEEIGDYLVRHPQISIVSFTGSFEVGAQIIRKASCIAKNQKNIKKTVVEMGGKNAIIIDSSADLDMAVSGVIHSAFGFQGQKCSACSRVIVLEDIYDKFIERFLPAVQSLLVGLAEKPEISLGPLIDESAFKRVCRFIEKESASLLFKGSLPEDLYLKSPKNETLKESLPKDLYIDRKNPRDENLKNSLPKDSHPQDLNAPVSSVGENEERLENKSSKLKGWFCPPVVYLTDKEDSALMQEELFAPLLAIIKVKDLDSAIKQANNSRFGLTAGFYSRHPAHIKKFQSLIEAGNLYINRNCTGALVKRHPFGGRKMSGLGSKAGGPEYLKQFMHIKISTENKMRRGFSPDLLAEEV